MIKMRGIAVTDQINRYNEKLDFEGMIRAYENAWDKGFPVGINHDHTKCIGWSQLNGIYMEPGISYQSAIPHTSSTRTCSCRPSRKC